MDGLVMAGQLLLGLSILIVLHELGHFLAARAFGIKVEKFFLFFDAWGVKLFSFKYKGCEYGIGWLPLGGYVKIAGMIDESMDTGQMSGPPQPWEFRSKPAWQRLIVMLSGIAVNIVLGIFIFWMLTFKFGEAYIPNDKLVNGIVPGVVGKSIGLQTGDKIVSINGERIQRFEEVSSSKVLMGGGSVVVDRAGEKKNIAIPGDILEEVADHGIDEFVQPRVNLGRINEILPDGAAKLAGFKAGDSILAINNQQVFFFDEFQQTMLANKGKKVDINVVRNNEVMTLSPTVSREGLIGISIAQNIPVEHISHDLLTALPIGTSRAWGMFIDNAKGIGKVLTGQVKANKALSGPIGIATMFGGTVNWIKFWTLVGLLSMALALMNLLPIPALDGGHALFLIVEMIKGKPLSDKFMEKAQIVGFFIIMALMIFALGNDVLKHIIK